MATISVKLSDLQEIDSALVQAMDALESDADLEARREAFEAIQDLYWKGKILHNLTKVYE